MPFLGEICLFLEFCHLYFCILLSQDFQNFNEIFANCVDAAISYFKSLISKLHGFATWKSCAGVRQIF